MAHALDGVTNEHLLGSLTYIHEKLDRMSTDISEVKGRVGILEMQYASLSRRVDKLDERVERIEGRMDLVTG